MAITKLSSGPYIIHTINNGDPIILDSGNVIISGNLTVLGATSAIETTNTIVYDNIITLNGGTTGVPILNAGLEVSRGTSANVDLIWSEVYHRWQVTNDGTTFANIVYSSGPGTVQVFDDKAPMLGGNLNLNGYTVTSNVGNMNFQGNIQVNYSPTIPTTTSANSVTVYSVIPTSGGTGLYVINSAYANEELVTKKRALGFSILF